MQIVFIIAALLTVWYTAVIFILYIGLKQLRPAGEPACLRYSVIIAARNEEKNIGPCLERVLAQHMSPDRYEVIVVDDRSTDATASIVERWRVKHANLSLVRVTQTPAGAVPKKHAVLQGMAQARNEIIVLTDADCLVPPAWLETIDGCFAGNTGLVQGITAYVPLPGMGKVFFGFQAVDFLSHGVVAAAAIGAGLPLNSNANNMAFRRSAFDDVGGYGTQSGIVSGDDDLLLQRIWKSGKWKVRFMSDKAGAVETYATPTVKGVLDQRKRWGSITVHYNPVQTIMLAGIFLYYCGIPAVLLAGIFHHSLLWIAAAMMGVKISGELLLMIPATRLFGQTALRPFLILASFVQLPLVLYAVFAGVFGKFEWKGQEFKRVVKRLRPIEKH